MITWIYDKEHGFVGTADETTRANWNNTPCPGCDLQIPDGAEEQFADPQDGFIKCPKCGKKYLPWG